MPHPILIVEDDLTVSSIMSGYLQSEGLRVDVVSSAHGLLERVARQSFSLVLLDLGLPDEDGLALMRKLRGRTATPIMVVTARAEIDTRLIAFELGAADILVKPFDPRELRHRVLNLIRRHASHPSQPTVFELGRWRVDLGDRTVRSIDTDAQCKLTRVEFDTLVFLLHGAGRVFTRAQIIDAISSSEEPESDRAIDTLVSRLRRKLSEECDHSRLIVTVQGVGYRLELRPLQSDSGQRS
ncbi:response regulator transcription factor [Variovorax sp. OV329]|uniref:response regulator transcription factor n=1 Tax=Variovorax sp. OV329 TaxID=1882825 RepID=UPI0008E10146|nr:response regulator transcription factor [Variovorax sp. OV329]SFM93702.1 two-component system, OmpR family, response regulator BaeR [Variovorax sp. OV329]